MDISEIAADKGLPSRLFQAGWIDEHERFVNFMPRPFGIVSLAVDPKYDANGRTDLLNESTFLYRRWLHDDARGVMSDGELEAMADFVCHQMDQGIHVFVHCVAGQSRSSYILSAILSKALGLSGLDALEIVKRDRGVERVTTNMQRCFVDHLAHWKNGDKK